MFLFIIGQLDFGNNLLFAIYSVFMKLNIFDKDKILSMFPIVRKNDITKETALDGLINGGDSGFYYIIGPKSNFPNIGKFISGSQIYANMLVLSHNPNRVVTEIVFTFNNVILVRQRSGNPARWSDWKQL